MPRMTNAEAERYIEAQLAELKRNENAWRKLSYNEKEEKELALMKRLQAELLAQANENDGIKALKESVEELLTSRPSTAASVNSVGKPKGKLVWRPKAVGGSRKRRATGKRRGTRRSRA